VGAVGAGNRHLMADDLRQLSDPSRADCNGEAIWMSYTAAPQQVIQLTPHDDGLLLSQFLRASCRVYRHWE